MSDPQPASSGTAGPSSPAREVPNDPDPDSNKEEETNKPDDEPHIPIEGEEGTISYLLSRLPDAGQSLSAHEKADLAQEILALREEHRPGKVKEHAKNIAIKCNIDTGDTENKEDGLDALNEIMKQLSLAEDEEGEQKTKEELLQIYLGFNSTREIDLKVKIEGEFNVTVLL